MRGTINEDIERKQLIWYEHVGRMNDDRLPKQILVRQSPGRRKRGGGAPEETGRME